MIIDESNNPKAKQYTFRQQYFSGLIQRLLAYIFISQNFQLKILNSISTDLSPNLCLFQNLNQFQSEPGFRKFNNFLVSNEEYV